MPEVPGAAAIVAVVVVVAAAVGAVAEDSAASAAAAYLLEEPADLPGAFSLEITAETTAELAAPADFADSPRCYWSRCRCHLRHLGLDCS